MKYLDKIMFEKPYPILLGQDGQLRLQVGIVLFQEISDISSERYNIRKIPVTVPVSSQVSDYDVYCDIDPNVHYSLLCKQGEAVDLRRLNVPMMWIGDGVVAGGFDASWLLTPLELEGVKFSVPDVKTFMLPLSYKPDSRMWRTDLEEACNTDCSPFLYLYACDVDENDVIGTAISLSRQAAAFDDLFRVRYGRYPDYEFHSVDASQEGVVREISDLVRKLLALVRVESEPGLGENFMIKILDYLDNSFSTDAPDVFQDYLLYSLSTYLSHRQYASYLDAIVDFGLYFSEGDNCVTFRHYHSQDTYKAVHFPMSFKQRRSVRPDDRISRYFDEICKKYRRT